MRVKKIDKLNQKGMSLIEVVVAVAILAVVVAPTLRIFASTAGTNFRSRQRQRATSVAEGTMESLKAYDMSQICGQFAAQSFKGVVPSTDGAYPTSMTVSAQKGGVHVPVFRDDGSWNREADLFEFQVFNAASEGQYYNVDIKAKAHLAPDVLRIDNPNKYSDAIIKLSEDSAYLAYDELKALAQSEIETNISSYHTGATSASNISVSITDFTRVIDLAVNDNGSSQTVDLKVTCTAKANVTYNYTVAGVTHTGGSQSFDDTLLTYECDVSEDGSGATTWTVYDNSATIGGAGETYASGSKFYKLDQICLYYFPCYSTLTAFGTGARDEINLSGTLTGLYKPSASTDPEVYGYEALQLTVAKQYPTRVSGVDLNTGDTNYNLDVDCAVLGGGEVKLKHNLDESFSSIDSSTPAPIGMTGFTSTADLKSADVDRVILFYDVQIDVYEADNPTKLVAQFIGTMNE